MKKLSIIFAFLSIFCSLYAQEQNKLNNLAVLWETIPDSICPLKGEAKIDSSSTNSNCLNIKISKSSSVQITKFETTSKDTVICLINTYYAPAAESKITFYDTNWNRVGNQPLDFTYFCSDSNMQKYFSPTLISAIINNDKTLSISLSDQNISEEDKKIISFPLTKTLKWNGNSFN